MASGLLNRSVRRTIRRTVIAAVCVLGLVVGVPAVAGDSPRGSSPARDRVGGEPPAARDGAAKPPAARDGAGPAKSSTARDRVGMEVRPAAPDVYELAVRGSDGTVRTVTLSCTPLGGTHPAARAACAQLTAVRGEVDRIPARDGVCSMLYDPVTLRADGVWHGQPRTYAREFTNRCLAVRDTGGVLFDF